jgi:glycosyltransferase involved in cell wall biosynthesis
VSKGAKLNKLPKVSVGLPVYNGEAFLAEALDSILGQTYVDFELIISDNGSTDRTQEICGTYAARDPRIRYYRNDSNHGASWNFNRVFELSTGEYFKWAAHDDVCAPDFLRKCVRVLSEDSSVVLAYPRAVEIDAQGRFMHKRQWNLRGDSYKPHERLRYQICVDHWCLHVFGVFRASALRKTKLIDKFVASDRVLLAHLALLGRFHEEPDALFFRRHHPLRSTQAYPSLQSRAVWFDPASEGRLVFPTWRLLAEYAQLISRCQLNASERMRCYFQLLRWIRWHWRTMINDLTFATRQKLMAHEH